MNLWILTSLVACFLGVWVPAVHTQGAFEDCCLGYNSGTSWAMLRHAKAYRVQEVSGGCNLPAVIFYFHKKRQMVCGNPQNGGVQKAIAWIRRRLKAPQNSDPNTWQTFQGWEEEVEYYHIPATVSQVESPQEQQQQKKRKCFPKLIQP